MFLYQSLGLQNKMIKSFGSLTLSVLDETPVYNKKPLDFLFQNYDSKLVDLTVIEAEYKIAFENLKKLTTELQTKRLRYNAKSACKYFTL